MQRIPEPELMNDPAQALAYAEADFSVAHDAFVAHFAARFPQFKTGRVLDLGCGPADVTLRFARAYPHAELLGIDAAEAMLALGHAAVARAGCADRVHLHQAYLPDVMLEARAFDAVISNSLLHHLAAPQVLWDSVRHAAKPRAALFVMDLLRPETRTQAEQLAMQYAHDAPEILQRDFLNSLLAAYRVDEVRMQLTQAGMAHLCVETVSDRHWVAWGMLE